MATTEAHSLPTRGEGTQLDGDALLADARRLYALISDGHDRLAYNGSGLWPVRDRGTREPAAGWPYVERGDWQRARWQEHDGGLTDRRLNPHVVRQHIRGSYDVAAQAPSWCSWFAFDIDAHGVGLEAVCAARARRDATLGAVWRAMGFGADKQPVILETPNAGYHVYCPLTRGEGSLNPEHTWPAEWIRMWVEHHLALAGVPLAGGVLELYPSGRPLRMPCGRGTALLVPTRPDSPNDLGLQPAPGTSATRFHRGRCESERVRRPGPLVAAFCDAWEIGRRPLDAWLDRNAAGWSAVDGPFVREPREKKGGVFRGRARRRSQHIDDVQSSPGGLAALDPDVLSAGQGGVLVFGQAFTDKVRVLTESGLTQPCTRHDAILTLTFYWGATCALGEVEVLRRVEQWCRDHAHCSRLSGETFVATCLREAKSYYRSRAALWEARGRRRGAVDIALRPLTAAEGSVLDQLDPAVRPEAKTLLAFLRAQADPAGLVPEPVVLSGRLVAALCPDRRILSGDGRRRRAAVVAIEELERLGVLALHCDYSTGHHGRMFSCWYTFGSGVLPARAAPIAAAATQTLQEAPGGAESPPAPPLVLAERRVSEGLLRVLSDGRRGEPRVELDAGPGLPPPGLGEPWWQRMYQRRRFSPAEFFTADPRRVVPFPEHRALALVPRVAYHDPDLSPPPYGALAAEQIDPHAPIAASVRPLPTPEPAPRSIGCVDVTGADPALVASLERAWSAWERRNTS